jgi:gliding motility-associated-like protein
MRKILLFYLGVMLSMLVYGHQPEVSLLEFIENKGQWENEVRFRADLKGGWVFLQENAATYLFYEEKAFRHGHKTNAAKQTLDEASQAPVLDAFKAHAYRTTWIGANRVVPIAEQQFAHYLNYFVGNDPAKWKSEVKAWKVVHYPNLYNGIDLKIYSTGTGMKSDYIVKAGASPSTIQIAYEGVDKIFVMKDGRLNIQTSVNEVFELAPYAYQMIQGKKVEVTCQYELKGGTLSFRLPKGYDQNYDLVIDPSLIFSTYSGSNSDNWGSSATNDKAGNMFLGGIALGASFPTTLGAFQVNFGGGSGANVCDVAITKISSGGTNRIYSTYLGGNSNEILTSLLCTDQNELIALVTTSSLNYPTTPNAFRTQFNGGTSTSAFQGSITFPNGTDIAITKFNAAGSALIGSTYFGGSGNDGLNNAPGLLFNYGDESRSDMIVDKQGNIYVASVTNSNNIPGTGNAFQSSISGLTDGLVFKMNANLTNLVWASYYGGSQADGAYGIQLDESNNIFICGGTRSTNIPGTQNGLNSTFRGGTVDGFVAKINNNGTQVLNASYLGTNAYDQAYLLDLDRQGNVVLFGQTLGTYPVTQGVYSNPNAKQFIHKLNNALTGTVYSTVFGSPNSTLVNISPTALLVDICGAIYAVGWGGGINFDFQLNAGTTANMPVTPDAFRANTDNADFYLINLSSDAKQLLYGSYFGELGSTFLGTGEDHVDGGTSRFDKNGVVYQAVCASCGGSDGFPTTPGAISSTNNSTNCNMAGVKFRFDLQALQIVTANALPAQGCSPFTTSFSYTATRPGTQFFWDFGDGTTSTSEFPSHTYNQPGTYTVKFIIRNPDDCNPVDSATFTVTVLESKRTTVDRVICPGQSVTVGNQTFTTAGSYQVTLQGFQGCDSIVTLNLGVSDSIINNLSQQICSGEVFQLGNQTLTESGFYSATFQTSAGCDSIVNLNLTVIDSLVEELFVSLCEGQSITIAGVTYSETGFYTIQLESVAGCDSILNLNLLISDKLIFNVEAEICQGDSFKIAGRSFSESGQYQINLPGELCDTTIIVDLTVNPRPAVNATADTTLVSPGTTVTLNAQAQGQLQYAWSPPQTVSNPSGQTTTATVFENTVFFVTVTDENGCTSTDSVLVRVIEEDCKEENVFIPSAFTPNGDGKNDKVFVRSTIPLTNMRFIIYNRWGEKVFETNDQTVGWDGRFRDKDAHAGVFGYYLEGRCGETIIERKGNITLIR